MSSSEAMAWVAERNAMDASEIRRLESWLEEPRNATAARRAATFISRTARADEPGDRLLPLDSRGASSLLSVLGQHPAAREPRELQVLVDMQQEVDPESPRHRDAAELLAVGSLVLGMQSDPEDRLVEVIIHVAAGADAVSLVLRRALTGKLELWDPREPLRGLTDPLTWLRPELDTCVLRIRQAGGALGRYVSALRAAGKAEVTSSAEGITALRPDTGSCGDVVALDGSFPANQPKGTSVHFPHADSGCRVSQVLRWSSSTIEVRVPEEVGEGGVGFVTVNPSTEASQSLDVGAPLEFANALMSCVGPAAGPIAGRLTTFPPKEFTREIPCPPVLPGDLNVFRGGPILDSLSASAATERDADPVGVTGRNLRPGDAVIVEGIVCPTEFIDPTRLEFRVKAIPAGIKSARIRRGTCRSNLLPLRIFPTLDPAPLGRTRPGVWRSVKGTGFAKREMFVDLNGESAITEVNDTYSLDFRVFRPRINPPTGGDARIGETVRVDVSHVGSAVGATTLTLDMYRIAIFGDSIVWGQGLVESTKFTTLLAQFLAERFAGSIAVSIDDRLAHSGARITPPGGIDTPANAATPFLPGNIRGEVPATVPSVTAQVTAWAALGAEASQVNLVVLDGGINDVDVDVILNPFADDAALVAATRRACRADMAGLLNLVRSTFPSVERMIVTGYYPIVSAESDLDALYLAIAGLGLLTPVGPLGAVFLKEWLRTRLVQRSALFSEIANTSLRLAIQGSGDSRIALAVPSFGPSNAVFATDSYLFGVGVSVSGLIPLDPVAPSRLALPGCAASVTCRVASLGHPNAAGARAYFDAIRGLV